MLSAAIVARVAAQPMLYAQRLPEDTVYIRLVNTLPGAIHVHTGFAGTVELDSGGAARVSPYFVAGGAGGQPLTLQIDEAGRRAQALLTPPPGSFVTVVLQRAGEGVSATVITDKPEYNQLRARLAFYNAIGDCATGSLAEPSGRVIFSAVAADAVAARSINPVAASVVASCGVAIAPPLALGRLEAGGLYTVWMMRPAGSLVVFVARDTIAPPH